MAEALSKREQTCLQHVKQAEELGVSFAEFCRSFDLNVNTCYTIRRSLVRKGAIASRTKADEKEAVKEFSPATPASFAQVRIAPPAAPEVICRVLHPRGWVIECASWPEGSWLAALFGAGEHAAS